MAPASTYPLLSVTCFFSRHSTSVVLALLLRTGWLREHRHILKTTRVLFISASMRHQFFTKVVLTSIYLINHSLTVVLSGLSPFKHLFTHPPTYSHLRVFGYTCSVLLPPTKCTKLSPRSVRCIFLKYSSKHKGISVLIQLLVGFVFLSMSLSSKTPPSTPPLLGYLHPALSRANCHLFHSCQ